MAKLAFVPMSSSEKYKWEYYKSDLNEMHHKDYVNRLS